MRAIITGIFIMILVLDVIALVFYGVDYTISRTMVNWSSQQPIIPFIAGVICGHVFWPQLKVLECPACSSWEDK